MGQARSGAGRRIYAKKKGREITGLTELSPCSRLFHGGKIKSNKKKNGGTKLHRKAGGGKTKQGTRDNTGKRGVAPSSEPTIWIGKTRRR